jgi:hypothetical protein
MKKRQFLTPLAVSVAALLGGATVPVQASTVPVATTLSESSASKAVDLLVLTRSTGNELRLAQHESHSSHVSHESHSSHVSGG